MEIPISLIFLIGGIAILIVNYKVLPNESIGLAIVGGVAVVAGLGGVTGVVDYATIGQATDSGNGGDGNGDDGITRKAIDNISITTRTLGANSYTAYTGDIKLWEPDMDPGDANANAVSTATMASGVGSINARGFGTGESLKLTLDGSTTWYDMLMPTSGDFVIVDESQGIIKFTTPDTTEESVSPEVEFTDIVTVATLDDMIEENAVGGNLYGQTSCVNGTTDSKEICVGATGA